MSSVVQLQNLRQVLLDQLDVENLDINKRSYILPSLAQVLLSLAFYEGTQSGGGGAGGGGGSTIDSATVRAGIEAATNLDTIETSLSSINLNVDGIETNLASVLNALANSNTNLNEIEGLLATVISSLTTSNTNTSNTKTSVDAVNLSLSTLITNTDTLENVLSQIKTNTDDLKLYTDTVESLSSATNTKLDTVNSNLTTQTTSVNNTTTAINTSNTHLSAIKTASESTTTQLTNLNAVSNDIEVNTLATVTNTSNINTSVGITNTRLNTTNTTLDSINSSIGLTNEAVATSDNAIAGLNGLLKRLLTHISTLLTKLPSSLGVRSSADSLSVVLANDSTLLPINPAYTYTSYIGTNVSAVTKSSSTNLHTLSCINLSSQLVYLQLFNRNTVPTVGTVPLSVYPLYESSGYLVIDSNYLGQRGFVFSTGLTWGISSTPLTYTAVTSPENFIVEMRYV